MRNSVSDDQNILSIRSVRTFMPRLVSLVSFDMKGEPNKRFFHLSTQKEINQQQKNEKNKKNKKNKTAKTTNEGLILALSSQHCIAFHFTAQTNGTTNQANNWFIAHQRVAVESVESVRASAQLSFVCITPFEYWTHIKVRGLDINRNQS